MEYLEIMKKRHSVRQYKRQSIEESILHTLQAEIDTCNREGGLHIQLITDEPKAFDSPMAHYGRFSGVTNYIALAGRKGPKLDEKCGYYGERIVLLAQQLGLNTCWVALTYRKVPGVFQIDKGEKLTVVIALGYGETQGAGHKIKTREEVSNIGAGTPEWFQKGVEAALLAPTAVNQQKFYLTCSGSKVEAKAGRGFYTKVDLGIVKYHFELAAGAKNFQWA